MIELTDSEKKWIKLCKGHSQEIYPFTGNWVKNLKPLFKELYGWEADTDYYCFLNSVFNRLLDLHLKIQNDQSGINLQLKELFSSAFSKSLSIDQDLPIERAIAKLCGLIQGNKITDDEGNKRYEFIN